jgi:hypothetical protein
MKWAVLLFSAILFQVLVACPVDGAATPIEVTSPGGKIVIDLQLRDGQPHWSVQFDRSTVLLPTRLGIVPSPDPFAGGFQQIGIERESVDSAWKPAWGKFATIRDCYNEVTWQLREMGNSHRRLEIVVRAYDDGVGVRYRLIGSGKLVITDDRTHFAFAGDPTCWSANYERPSIGPVALSKYRGTQFPITLQVSDDCYCAILETAD